MFKFLVSIWLLQRGFHQEPENKVEFLNYEIHTWVIKAKAKRMALTKSLFNNSTKGFMRAKNWEQGAGEVNPEWQRQALAATIRASATEKETLLNRLLTFRPHWHGGLSWCGDERHQIFLAWFHLCLIHLASVVLILIHLYGQVSL